jgi:hypothetical protein
LEESREEDRIIDLIIALEALYSSTSEDLSYKLRLRISVLLGQDDNESQFLFKFINKAYGIRSKLVHGKISKESFREFEIDSKKFSLYSIAIELERITRLSIIKLINLLNYQGYNKQEDIMDSIDKAAIGESKKLIRKKTNSIFKVKQ